MKDRDQVLKILEREFPEEAIFEREGAWSRELNAKQKFKYIKGHTAIHRLNEATDNEWSFRVIGEPRMLPQPTRTDKNGNEKASSLLVVYGELTIPAISDLPRGDFGVQMINEGGGEDLYKGATTDCLKRCARMFGMALHLYGEDYEFVPLVSEEVRNRLKLSYNKVTGKKLTAAVYVEEMTKRSGKPVEEVTSADVLLWIEEIEQGAESPIAKKK